MRELGYIALGAALMLAALLALRGQGCIGPATDGQIDAVRDSLAIARADVQRALDFAEALNNESERLKADSLVQAVRITDLQAVVADLAEASQRLSRRADEASTVYVHLPPDASTDERLAACDDAFRSCDDARAALTTERDSQAVLLVAQQEQVSTFRRGWHLQTQRADTLQVGLYSAQSGLALCSETLATLPGRLRAERWKGRGEGFAVGGVLGYAGGRAGL